MRHAQALASVEPNAKPRLPHSTPSGKFLALLSLSFLLCEWGEDTSL